MTRPAVSVIIVTWNSAPHLRETLDALFAQRAAPPYEAVLLDNASTDESLAIAQQYEPHGLRMIQSSENLGFGGGNNRAVAETASDIVLLLNPDCTLPPDALRRIVRVFRRNPAVALLGGKLVASDGVTLLHCGGRIDSCAHTISIGRGERDHGQYDHPRRVQYVCGALMAVRRTVWDELGGFDKAFHPAYYEDTDLCARARRLGHRVCYVPLRAVHHENVSMPVQSPEFLALHHRNRLRYVALNFPLGRLLFRFLPAEIMWLASWHSKDARRLCVRQYPAACALALRRRFGL